MILNARTIMKLGAPIGRHSAWGRGSFRRLATRAIASGFSGSSRPTPSRKISHPLVGTRVRHKTFGTGTILAVEEEEDDRTLTISFPDHGTKKMKERYANLQLA